MPMTESCSSDVLTTYSDVEAFKKKGKSFALIFLCSELVRAVDLNVSCLFYDV